METVLSTQKKNDVLPSMAIQEKGINLFDTRQFETAQRASKVFAASFIVPKMYQAKEVGEQQAVANCLIALDMAMRLGASPLMVMQNLVIIYGRPSWSSKFLISTVNTCGRFEPLRFRFTNNGYVIVEGKEIDNIECVAYTTKKGGEEEILESSPVSIALAINEGWYLKNGSKWKTMPKQMLMYRAASFWTSVYAPELSMGMSTAEEMQDIEAVEVKEKMQKQEDNKQHFESVNPVDAVTEALQRQKRKRNPKQKESAKEMQVEADNEEFVGDKDELLDILFPHEKSNENIPQTNIIEQEL